MGFKSASWVLTTLSGRQNSRAASGALVSVTHRGQTTTHELFAGGGYLCANQRMLSLPCSAKRIIESLRIQWPGNQCDDWTNVKVSTHMLAVESSKEATARLVTLGD